MASSPKLSPEVVKFLSHKLGKAPQTVRKDIYILRRDFPSATLNATAQIYAELHDQSVRRFIPKQDKATIPRISIERPPVLKGKKGSARKERIIEVIQFETDDPFLSKHIKEINRAYTRQCLTCVFVLTRKVIENLIISILRKKYPADRALFYDSAKKRYLDFSVVLKNLFDKRDDFDEERKKAIERLNQRLKPFKSDANDKAHSLFHIVETRKEIDDWTLGTIMDLIRKIV